MSPPMSPPMSMAAKPPKVELHVHLDGAFDGHHLYELARRHVDSLPETVDVLGKGSVPLQQAVRAASSAEAFLAEHVHLAPSTCTLSDFLAPFGWVKAIVIAAIRCEGLQVLDEVAYHFAKRQAENNVVYTEVRWCPHLLLLEEQETAEGDARYAAARDVFQAVTRGLRRGEEDFGITLRQLFCCIDFLPQVSDDLARLLVEEGRAAGCVGIDVAGGEGHFGLELPNNPCLRAVLAAKAAGFGVTVHAGEDANTGGSAANVRAAIETYGATRIGHGYLTLSDEGVTELAKTSKVHFECCPTSSLLTGGFAPRPPQWARHPLCRFREQAMSCGVNTDDPLFCGVCLEDEFALCQEQMGLDGVQMRALTESAIDAAFCEEGEKARLRKLMAAFYDRKESAPARVGVFARESL